jgi:hypothetical protein
VPALRLFAGNSLAPEFFVAAAHQFSQELRLVF